MYLDCSYRAEVCRESNHSYLHEYCIEIGEDGVEINEQGLEIVREFVVGRALIDKLLWQTAQLDGTSLYDICDEDSAGWEEVHQTISDPDDPQELRSDLRVDEGVSEVLFMHRVVLHPDITDRVAVLDAVFQAVTDDDAIVVMWNAVSYNTAFTDQEYVALGFRKIAGSDLIYRDCHRQTPFGKAHPRGKAVGFSATPDHERWLNGQWERKEPIKPEIA